jgi:hypothetical protein
MPYQHKAFPTTGRGWAVVNYQRQVARRTAPTRRELSLRNAIEALGLTVIGWNHDVWIKEEDMDVPVFFHAAIELNGRPAYIWFADKHVTPGNPFNTEARRRRIKIVNDNECYGLEVWDGTAQALEAEIELWLMTLARNPVKLATKRRAGRPKKMNHRPGNRH